MIKKYKNKYRIPSSRLPNWDYSRRAKYHITICTRLMQHFFGHIENEEMKFSPEGEIALEILTNLPKKFKFLHLDEFQIMPNHLHVIIIIVDKVDQTIDTELDQPSLSSFEITSGPLPEKFDDIQNLTWQCLDSKSETQDKNESATTESIPFLKKYDDIPDFEKIHIKPGGITGKHNPMLKENLSTALRFFKGKSAFLIHKINESFDWHPRFYDTIIRDSDHLEKIRNYIRHNPKKWAK